MVRCIGMLLLAAASVSAGERFEAEGPVLNWGERIQPSSQIALGFGLPTGEVGSSDRLPQLSAQFLRFFADWVALRAELDYTPKSGMDVSTRAAVYRIGGALRIQFPVRPVSPFLESGFDIDHYAGTFRGRPYDKTALGLAFGTGLALGPHHRHSLDLFLTVHIGRIGMTADEIIVADAARPTAVSIYPPPKPTEIYNSAHLGVRWRFGL